MNISSKKEFLSQNTISFMSSFEILSYLRNGYIEIKFIINMKNPNYKMNKKTISWILVCSKLNLHGSKLYPPTNLIINRYLKTNRVPISAIKHLEEKEIIWCHLFEISMDYKIVSFEYISYMKNHSLINLNLLLFCYFSYCLELFLFDSCRKIVIFSLVYLVIP